MRMKKDIKRVIQWFVALVLLVLGVSIFLPYKVAIFIVEVLILLFVAGEGGLSWLVYRTATKRRRSSRKPKIERLMNQLSQKLTQHSRRD